MAEDVEVDGQKLKYRPEIPDFEGKEVAFTVCKITSVGALEMDDAVWKVDDYVKMEIEARVVGVQHVVNEKTGKLARVHVIKAVDGHVVPWDE